MGSRSDRLMRAVTCGVSAMVLAGQLGLGAVVWADEPGNEALRAELQVGVLDGSIGRLCDIRPNLSLNHFTRTHFHLFQPCFAGDLEVKLTVGSEAQLVVHGLFSRFVPWKIASLVPCVTP